MNNAHTLILKDNKGAALIISLFVMLLLALIGAAALMSSSTETKISGNVMTSKKAFYAAEAGLERFKTTLKGDWDWSDNGGFSGSLSDGRSSYVVTVLASPAQTSSIIAIRSVGTFHDANATIEAYFNKTAFDKTVIDDTGGNIGKHL